MHQALPHETSPKRTLHDIRVEIFDFLHGERTLLIRIKCLLPARYEKNRSKLKLVRIYEIYIPADHFYTDN